MIRTAIEICRRIKDTHPDLPILFGGWHPSLMPEQTLQARFIDAVVRGRGELTLLEVVQRLANGESLQGTRGVTHKHEGRIVNEPDRPVENVNNLPPPAYHLVDFHPQTSSGVSQY
jgi:anaerobic magnesium-protoporphyrin IX monomethyl ester cyclase